VVFDWEMAREAWPTYYDLFHFFIQPQAFLTRNSGRQILQNLAGEPINMAQACLGQVGRAGLPGELYLLFYLSDISLFYHEIDLLEQSHWRAERNRLFTIWGELMDLLLSGEQLRCGC